MKRFAFFVLWAGAGFGQTSQELRILNNAVAQSQDEFGGAVAVHGDWAVVGAPLNDGVATDAGVVHLYERNQGGANQWGYVGSNSAGDGAASDEYGAAVALDGDILVVGAPLDDDNGTSSGAVYIYGRDQGGTNNWGLIVKRVPGDGSSFDQFGYAVAVNGGWLLVGAPDDGAGSAYLFARDQGGTNNWGEVSKLTPGDGAAADQFGISVSIHGGRLAIGAMGNDEVATNAGAAYIYSEDAGGGGTWSFQAKLSASDGEIADRFGASVGIFGTDVVVGAYGDDDNGADSGAVYFFEQDTGGLNNWGLVGKRGATDGAANDWFGRYVAISGERVIVGSYWDDDNGANSGSGYVFIRNGGSPTPWQQTLKLLASNGDVGDDLGRAVAVHNDIIVLGAPFAGMGGGAYLYSTTPVDNDGDGVVAGLDSNDNNNQVCMDTDSDSCDDCSISGPLGQGAMANNDGPDLDGDGLCDAGDSDRDGDGVEDGMDSDNSDSSVCMDMDLDTCDDCTNTGPQGLGADSTDDGDDLDMDGACNAGDSDDDDDGVLDENDLCPQGALSGTDTDGDGCFNSEDDDDDNDGILDGADDCPQGALSGTDTDGDGCFNSEDDDDDNDTVNDMDDPAPLDPTICGDGDSDRCDDCAGIPDTDSDGFCDTYEESIGSFTDDDDSDDDGVLDSLEPDHGEDTDGDEIVNVLDPDSDNDGLFDGLELGMTSSQLGTDEEAGFFVVDLDPSSTTDPLSADTDSGGISDGDEDTNGNGRIDDGETDPNDSSDDIVGTDGGMDGGMVGEPDAGCACGSSSGSGSFVLGLALLFGCVRRKKAPRFARL